MIVKNFTNIKKREKRVYTIFDFNISKEGLVVSTLQIMGALLFIFTIFGIAFCFSIHKNMYSPFNLLLKPKSTLTFYTVFVFIPLGLGGWLNNYKIQNYRMIDYLKIMLMPKVPKNSDGKKLTNKAYKIDSIVDRVK